MGKPTGFLEYDRVDPVSEDPKERINNWNEFHEHLSLEEQKKQAVAETENTDVLGFAKLLEDFCIDKLGATARNALAGKHALVLGTGGASQAVAYVLEQMVGMTATLLSHARIDELNGMGSTRARSEFHEGGTCLHIKLSLFRSDFRRSGSSECIDLHDRHGLGSGCLNLVHFRYVIVSVIASDKHRSYEKRGDHQQRHF